MLKKMFGKLISPLLYIVEDFLEQPLIMKGFIGAAALCLLAAGASFANTLPSFLEGIFG